MIFSEKGHLSILQIDGNCDEVSFDVIGALLFDKPSNVLYCEKDGKLYGIISMGDIRRMSDKRRNTVEINKSFTYLQGYEYMRARKIFLENDKINTLPIVDEEHRLLGAYSRWVDAFSGYEFDFLKGNKYADMFWKKHKKVAIVIPSTHSAKKEKLIEMWCEFFDDIGIDVELISKDKLMEAFRNKDIIFFTDEDEARGLTTFYRNILNKEFKEEQIKTLKGITEEIGCIVADGIGEAMAEVILKEVKDSGVCVITLQLEGDGSSYWENLEHEFETRFKTINARRRNILYKELWKDFYDDLYSLEYASEVSINRFSVEAREGCLWLKDTESKYCNVVNGNRVTIGQPTEYNNTIYFFGPCFVMGCKVDDAHTIESSLQGLLNADEIASRVVNCGCLSNERQRLLRIVSTKFKCGDIVIVSYDKTFKGIPSINLGDSLKRENVPARWFCDKPVHANHKVFKIWAEEIYKYIPKRLLENSEMSQIDKSEYKCSLLLAAYFERFFPKYNADGVIGSIVMNCNPFTKGHRYLIEQAAQRVDRLIVFVVEENKSLFDFKERYAMVIEGTRDIKNVTVVPSGDLILSQQTFPEYFIKVEDGDIVKNTEFDIRLFAEEIAPRLNIKYRFVGEENNDSVTRAYNQAMKKILPDFGIEVVEIPRKKINGTNEEICATAVREKIKVAEWEKIVEIVPQSTIEILSTAW